MLLTFLYYIFIYKTYALLLLKIVREGKEDNQGVGYLDDGTMVVIDNGKKHISEFINIVITSVIQTPTGRMIFSKVGDPND